MDDPRGVSLGQPLRNLHGDLQHLLGRQRAGREKLTESLSLDVLHGNVEGRVGGPDVVDRDDVGMVQAGGRSRLLLEPPDAILVGREICGEDLDGDFPTQPRVPSPVHLSHSADAESRDDLVGSET